MKFSFSGRPVKFKSARTLLHFSSGFNKVLNKFLCFDFAFNQILSSYLGQRFEVNQSQEGDQTNTTIVVVNNDDAFENPTATNVTSTDVVSNKYALTESKDLVSLAIDESGLEQNQNWTLPKIFGGTLSEQQVEEAYYSNEAEEILNSDTDPKLAKKRLKWENKIRAEDAAFSKKKREIEQETENYKRKFRQEQFQITQMEIELKSKKSKMETLQKDIDAFLKRS